MHLFQPYLDTVVAGNCELETGGDRDMNLWHEYCNRVRDQYDPRTSSVVWLKLINEHIAGNTFDTLKLPFSWPGVLDLRTHPKSCSLFLKSLDLGISRKNFSLYCTNENNQLKIIKALDVASSETASRAYAQVYLQSAPLPERAIFLLQDSSVVVPVAQGQIMLSHSLNMREEVEKFRKNAEQIPRSTDYHPITDYPRRISDRISRSLTKGEFTMDYTSILKDLKTRSSLNIFEQTPSGNDLDHRLLNTIVYQLSQGPNAEKYANEPKIKGAGHFDWRFFKHIEHSDYDRISRLHKLASAWLKFSNSAGLKTWLGHGTLLGWYWNGMNLPWDNDLDVQISMKSLIKLARNYNQSFVVDLDEEDPSGVAAFFIDVSTHIFERSKQNGENVIDARFIDVHSGLYIDITGLSFTEHSKHMSISEKQSVEFNQMLDPQYPEKERSQTLVLSELNKQLFSKRAQLYYDQTIFNCKNNHFYTLEELSPLKPTLFEGKLAYVPPQYEHILKREYPRGLYYKVFNKHSYHPVLRLWIPTSTCNFLKTSVCNDADVVSYYNHTAHLTYTHKQNMFYGAHQLDPLAVEFVDPWMLGRFRLLASLT
ncbi:hypothetical protein PSN45_003603 [Yamadazyma tenuis]|nr:hypothetical protein PSN45_003603 [Yamadazyma tenuis]